MDDATEQQLKPGKWCRFFLSWWQIPLLALLGVVVAILGVFAVGALYEWSGGAEVYQRCLDVAVPVAAALVLQMGAAILVWVGVNTAFSVQARKWWHLIRYWVCAVVAVLGGMLCLGGAFMVIMQEEFPSWYVCGVEIPAGRDFVAPRGLGVVQGDVREASPRAQELLNLRPRRQPLEVRVQIPPLPNLEKLTREAPELLQEYLLRCLYAEATNPRFDAQVLSHWHEPVALEHANDPQGWVLRAGLPGGADWKWKKSLFNGWSVVTPYQYPFDITEEEQVAGPLQLLEASLAPLAANPTREGLDALLPPLPQKPFLSLWNKDDGAYSALVVLPPGHPAGDVSLKVRELSTGKPVDMHQRHMPVVALGEVCSVAVDTMVLVCSGEVNEFYATEWEIWFTPEGENEPKCLGKQEFLLMGTKSWW